jgi:membrane-associated phospholipid phosphatase
MNVLLKKIKKADKAIETKFKGDWLALPPELDLFFKWLPAVYLLIAETTGVKTKHRFRERVIIIALSELILNSFVQPSKKIIHRRRPGSFFKYNSFPSGHTATSFSGAEILRQEVKEHSALLSLAGYTIATLTATLRLYKRKHWFSDIVAGAIVGIISAKLSCLLYKTKLSRISQLPNSV